MNFQYLNYFVKDTCYFLPIDKIDGVDVSVTIEKKDECMKLIISITNSEKRNVNYSINDDVEFNKVIDILCHLKLDKLSNKLVDERKDHPSFEFYRCLVSHNLKLSFDECCICFEQTRGKTICDHSICMACFSNLKNPICPLCKVFIFENL